MKNETKRYDWVILGFVLGIAGILAGAVLTGYTLPESDRSAGIPEQATKQITDEVRLPVQWGALGLQLVETGTINIDKLERLYAARGGLAEDELHILAGEEKTLVMTRENAPFLLNVLWAFGLANQNPVLAEGPMQDPRYGGAHRFASTGGWTLARGDAMGHYNAHVLVALTPEQQALVERVAKNIYRPCCGNSTYFPDCNHGMAMLGLLQLMAANNVDENEMYRTALAVNTLWFPGTYETLAQYFALRGVDWDDVDPKVVLGREYSSAQGYQQIKEEVTPTPSCSGAGCSV